MILHLGVRDVAYSVAYAPAAKAVKPGQRRHHSVYGAGKTTGDVAEILEAKYHIMETFVAKNKPFIAAAVERSLAGALKNILAGQRTNFIDPTLQGMNEIENRFRQSLSMREYDGAAGVPTQAAQLGISHRFKDIYNGGKSYVTLKFEGGGGKMVKGRIGVRRSRPSFIDTGLYQNSFVSWID